MKINESLVRKINITEIQGLDPVNVYIENFGIGRGRIVIECSGESWSNYWGAMGEHTIETFFLKADHHYIAGKLSNIENTIPAYDWWYDSPEKDNPKYLYLIKIIDIVKECLKQIGNE